MAWIVVWAADWSTRVGGFGTVEGGGEAWWGQRCGRGCQRGGEETICERGFLVSLSQGEGGASPKRCTSGTGHSYTR